MPPIKVLERTDDSNTDTYQSEEACFMATKSVKKTASAKKASFTARELLESKLVGLWADRKDIKDSAKFARKLREKAQNRYR
jgi:hypothetical protein